MFSLLIVDDERRTREFLAYRMPWNKLGIEVVHQAADGLLALELVLKHRPDIVLTDIVMPRMNGIELAAQLADKAPECKVILLSAHTEKHMLKSAIKLGVLDYIEKPADWGQIVESFGKVLAELRERREMFQSDTVQDTVTTALLDSGANLESLKPFLLSNQFNTPFTALLLQAHTTAVLEETIADLRDCGHEHKISLFFSAIKREPEHRIVCVTGNAEAEGVVELLRAAGIELREIWVSVGTSVGTLEEIFLSYQSACYGATRYFYQQPAGIFASPACIDDDEYEDLFDIQRPQRVFNALSLHSPEKARAEIILFSDELRGRRPADVNRVRDAFFLIFQQIDQFVLDQRLSLGAMPEREDNYLWEMITRFSTLGELEQYALKLIDWCFSGASDLSESEQKMKKILDFIELRLTDYNMGVSLLAQYINVTPSYICQVFKRQTGRTINQFITEQRIALSRSLLIAGNDSISVVAKRSGYNDAAYFVKVFKKTVGMTPTEYRRNKPC